MTVIKYADIRQRMKEFRRNGAPKGHSTGWDCIDEYYRPEKRFFTVVTGIPNHGKSRWLNALMVNTSIMHGWKHAVFSPESYPLELFFNGLVETYLGTSHDIVSDELYQEGIEFVDEHFHFAYPPDDDCTIDAIIETSATIQENYGCDTITIDPWTELEHRRPTWMSETEYVSHALTKFRKFCRERDVHGWVVAHPTKLQKDKDGNYPVPTPYDISGSANWRNKPDFCLSVHRPSIGRTDGDDFTQIHVQKMRYCNFGRLGMAEMSFDWRSGRYAKRGSKLFNLPRRVE